MNAYSGSQPLSDLQEVFPFICFTGEPTQSPHGSAAREMLKGLRPFDQDELLKLFIADRELHMEFVEKVLSFSGDQEPFKGISGDVLVIQDRGKYCNAAYQGKDPEHALEILKMNERFRDPDLIVYLDLTAEKCLERVHERLKQEDKGLEAFDTLESIRRVIGNYEAIFAASPVLVARIDASKPKDKVLRDFAAAVICIGKNKQ